MKVYDFSETWTRFILPGPWGEYVYVLRAADGEAIYVGMTGHPFQRVTAHMGQPWFEEVAAVELHECADRAAARALEREMIRTEGPRVNVQHNFRRRVVDRLHERIAAGEAA